MRLLDHSGNVYSQTGEDGIIGKILDFLPEKDQWCVEFGAWDGRFASNTRHLIESRGYAAVLIEADAERFRDLKRLNEANQRTILLNRFVDFMPEDNLDTLLAETPIPRDFDFLSIDIDGNDYHVWKAMRHYRPKLVCIEFNPTIPTELEFVQAANRGINHGSSLMSLVRLGQSKGYELVAVTKINAIFVRAEQLELFAISDNSPQKLREDLTSVTHIFSGYDGTIFLSGRAEMPWHGIAYASRLRQLPKYFRKYPGSFGRLRSRLWQIFRRVLDRQSA
jgi:hypothetical protein